MVTATILVSPRSMPAPLTLPNRTGPFRFAQPYVLGGRLRLGETHLELSGWQPFARYRRSIPMPEILHADAPEVDLLVLWLTSGELLRLRVATAEQWKLDIDRCASGGGSHTASGLGGTDTSRR